MPRPLPTSRAAFDVATASAPPKLEPSGWPPPKLTMQLDIIKTWPTVVEPGVVSRIFRPDLHDEAGFAEYYFTLGRGKPKHAIRRLYFTYSGRILGYFVVHSVVINDGSLPRLARLDGEESDWQIKPDRWVAICRQDCVRVPRRAYMPGFRGWRYFNFDQYTETPESRFRW